MVARGREPVGREPEGSHHTHAIDALGGARLHRETSRKILELAPCAREVAAPGAPPTHQGGEARKEEQGRPPRAHHQQQQQQQ